MVSSNPSGIRGFFWQPEGGGKAQYVTCKTAVNRFNDLWAKELDRSYLFLGRKFFSGRFINRKNGDSSRFRMNSAVEQALQTEMKSHLFDVTSYLGDIASNAEDTLKQTLMIKLICVK